jgi:hypothetical protein
MSAPPRIIFFEHFLALRGGAEGEDDLGAADGDGGGHGGNYAAANAPEAQACRRARQNQHKLASAISAITRRLLLWGASQFLADHELQSRNPFSGTSVANPDRRHSCWRPSAPQATGLRPFLAGP